jgi:hypothetical protein
LIPHQYLNSIITMPTLDQTPSFAKLPAASEDYSDFTTDTTPDGGEITQITGTPEEYHLKPIDPLEDFDDFDTWLEDVIQTLRPQNLHRFIDAYVKRPPKLHRKQLDG